MLNRHLKNVAIRGGITMRGIRRFTVPQRAGPREFRMKLKNIVGTAMDHALARLDLAVLQKLRRVIKMRRMNLSKFNSFASIVAALTLSFCVAGSAGADGRDAGHATNLYGTSGVGDFEDDYSNLEYIRIERVANYFVQNVDLEDIDVHNIKRNSVDQPSPWPTIPNWGIAHSGHRIIAGTGTVLVIRESEFEQNSYHWNRADIEQLTIFIPMGLSSGTTQIDFEATGEDAPIVFWSSWGGDRFFCYAYARNGTVELLWNLLHEESSSDQTQSLEQSRVMSPIVGQIRIQFEHVADQTFDLDTGTNQRLCPPFDIEKDVEFHWRPYANVVANFQ